MTVYLVNMDYEQKLFSNSVEKMQSNRINQEFEYLFFLLMPKETLYTTKKYTESYLQFIHQLTGNFPQIVSSKPSQLIPWWGSFEQIEQKRKLNSKDQVWLALQSMGLLPAQSELLHQYPQQLQQGFLYKDCTGFSGKGFVTSDEKKLKSLTLPIIKEPLLNRTVDFSYINLPDGNHIIHNLVDKNFQYKGTYLAPQLSLPAQLVERFKNQIVPGLVEFLGLDVAECWSVDTFCYQTEYGTEELYPASEVNYRRTMGMMALKLKQIFAPEFPYFEFRIRKQEQQFKQIAQTRIQNEDGGVVVLSPDDCLFQSIILYSKQRSGLMQLRLVHLGEEEV